MQGLDRNDVLAAGAAEAQAVALHGLHVFGPLVDERDVAPRPGQQPAHHAADRPRPDDADPLHGTPPGAGRSRPPARYRAAAPGTPPERTTGSTGLFTGGPTV